MGAAYITRAWAAAAFVTDDPGAPARQRHPRRTYNRPAVTTGQVDFELEDFERVSAAPGVALLRVTGSDPESARRLANAIGEWAGSAPVARPQSVVLADYRAAGLDTDRRVRRSRSPMSSDA